MQNDQVRKGSGEKLSPLQLRPNGVELASGKVAELVKSFEHVSEILDGFRYKMGAYPLNSTPLQLRPRVIFRGFRTLQH